MKVILGAAITADGFIGRNSNHLADWTGGADKKFFSEMTRAAGTIVMGSRTYATIGRALPGRRNIMYTTRPAETAIAGVETTSEPPADLITRLEQEGATGLVVCGGATIYHLFMAAGLVDELYLSVAPKLFGDGISLLGKTLDVNLALLENRLLDDNTVLLHYKVVKQ